MRSKLPKHDAFTKIKFSLRSQCCYNFDPISTIFIRVFGKTYNMLHYFLLEQHDDQLSMFYQSYLCLTYHRLNFYYEYSYTGVHKWSIFMKLTS